jgi:hypothetical protein
LFREECGKGLTACCHPNGAKRSGAPSRRRGNFPDLRVERPDAGFTQSGTSRNGSAAMNGVGRWYGPRELPLLDGKDSFVGVILNRKPADIQSAFSTQEVIQKQLLRFSCRSCHVVETLREDGFVRAWRNHLNNHQSGSIDLNESHPKSMSTRHKSRGAQAVCKRDFPVSPTQNIVSRDIYFHSLAPLII